MTQEIIIALIGFAFVSSITPGPNNLMLMASGANFGFQRTVPHMLGVGLGFTLMIVVVGLGLAEVFKRMPVLNLVLAAVSILYLLWLAWKIANAAPPQTTEITTESRPFTFLQAAAFQWVNPKAWTMALTAVTLYNPDNTLISLLIVAGTFGTVNIPSVGCWTILGQQMRRFLTNPNRLRAFNWTMAAMLVATLWPVVKPLI